MANVRMIERELTLTEASELLGVPRTRLKYALRTRSHLARRMAGPVMLVTLSVCRAALADVRRSGWPSIVR